ncbi:uncharacterized protein [Coffea arabica]|uniref:Endonuclease/exonuclease/phosphatase domain-containing protein n=1 Tax=Coffea arabica TaxID=13443 RepID=A0A6P6X617_COFAR|nr:uncharacterized protein LOC113739739 [Coffea arabica]
MVGEGAQHASFLIYHNCLPITVTISVVHAWCTREERRALWSGLLRDKPLHGPWLVGGDFNVVVEAGEKKRGLPFCLLEALDFLDFMSSAELFDAGFSGSSFMWCNNRLGRARIWKRLDRLLLNASCYDVGLAVSVSHLARDPSDHSRLLLSVKTLEEGKPRPFRFINAWTTHARFRDVVQRAEEAVLEAEKRVEEDGSSDAQESLQRANVEWRRCLLVEENFWRQTAKVLWLGLGDKNTKFFHSAVKQRRLQSFVHWIQDDQGNWIASEKGIGALLRRALVLWLFVISHLFLGFIIHYPQTNSRLRQ